MAKGGVWKDELNWSTYQDRLLKTLGDVEKALSYTNESIRDKYHMTQQSLDAFAKQIFTRRDKNLDDSMMKSQKALDQSTASQSSFTNALRSSTKAVSENSDAQKRSSLLLKEFSAGLQHAISFLYRVGKEADNYSQISNQMIKISGMGGDPVRDFREEIVDIVSDLNKETGGFFNPQESYRQLVAISQSVTGNLEALTEMSKPLLLAQETLDVDLNSIANTFNKFYTRYNFSSMAMEEMVKDIRSSSAGNQATATEIMNNIEGASTLLEHLSNGNQDQLTAWTETIGDLTSYYESMNINSDFIDDLMKDIYAGNTSTSIMKYLSEAGIDWPTARDMLIEGPGGLKDLTEAYIRGQANLFSEITTRSGASAGGRAAEVYEEDYYALMEAHNYMNSPNRTSYEEFLATREDTPLETTVEEKYIGIGDRIANKLDEFYELAARFQENTGIGISDIAKLLSMISSALMIRGAINRVGSLLSSTSTGAAVASTARSTAGRLIPSISAAGVATGAGALAGGGLVLDGISGVLDTEASGMSRLLSGAEAGLGGYGAAAILASATNPVGWIALAAGGATALGKAWYENATELTGNAKEIGNSFADIESSLRAENAKRIEDITDLSYRFSQEADVDEQRRLLKESGLFTEKELNDTADSQLKNLIDKYREAALAMGEVTSGVLKIAEDYYAAEQELQHSDFLKDLDSYFKNYDSQSQGKELTDVVRLLQSGVTDEKLAKKIEKYLKDDMIQEDEWKDLRSGGINSWFDKINIADQTLSAATMQTISDHLGFNRKYHAADASTLERVASLYHDFMASTDKDAAYQAIKDSGLEDEVRKVYGNQLKILGYSEGTNYIDRDQLAMLHEGEAVVPKKYNPSANITELEMLREQTQNEHRQNVRETRESQQYLLQTLEVLDDIREYLVVWREDNIRRQQLTESKSRFSSQAQFVNHYARP